MIVAMLLLIFANIIQAPGSATPAPAVAFLVEAREFEPCGSNCDFNNRHTTEYCFHEGDQSIVGESHGTAWMNENWKVSKAIQDHVGQSISIRYDDFSISILDSWGKARRISRGTSYEYFTDAGCLAEVHKPKLALASTAVRPPDIPADAFPLAAGQPTDRAFERDFLWFSCNLSTRQDDQGQRTLQCEKWTKSGVSRGEDHYCAMTVDGRTISDGYQIDPLLSREGRLVLLGGGVVMPDTRGRTNGLLDFHAGPSGAKAIRQP